TSGKRRRSVRGAIAVRSRSGRLVVAARMALDDYLAGTLSSEARSVDPREYLIALQVLQRNYVRTHRQRHAPYADVCDNTHCQLFHGLATSPRMRSIARDASVIALESDGSMPCYYSANCGGSSLTPARVWGANEQGYSVVVCNDCRNSRWHRWTRTIEASPRAIAALADAPAAPFVDDDFKIRVGRSIGFNAVPSNTVDRIERRGRSFRITGRGFGHRVGMCQDGARELALRGVNAKQILKRYFPAATILVTPPTTATP
ncbi:MAG: hypothetical protein H7X80_10810, partial [bacterium]|nr:hypothetical protein [Candidatus Kapabacteria bacterium]